MLLGLVQNVAMTDKGYYGFLITPEGPVYFQQRDYQPFCIDVDKDIVTLFGEGRPPETPKANDILYFMLGSDNQGRTKAEAWCPQAEGERIEALLAESKKFSIVRTRLAPSGKQETKLWEGYDPVLMQYETELKQPLEANNGYVDGIYTTYGVE